MEIKSLALSYFAVGLPPKYRRRSSVSLLSSGWDQCGSTAPKAPGKLWSVISQQLTLINNPGHC